MCPTPLCGSTNAVFMGRKLHCVYVMLRMRPQGWRQLLTFDYGTHYLKKAENCRKMSNCRGAPSCVSCVLGRGKCSTWLTKKNVLHINPYLHIHLLMQMTTATMRQYTLCIVITVICLCKRLDIPSPLPQPISPPENEIKGWELNKTQWACQSRPAKKKNNNFLMTSGRTYLRMPVHKWHVYIRAYLLAGLSTHIYIHGPYIMWYINR